MPIEMIGRKFGRLTVLSRAEDKFSKSGRAKVYWKCQCDCGTEVEVQADCLRRGNSTSCGCARLELLQARHKPLLPGEVYGELTIIEEVSRTDKRFKYLCGCSCGKVIRAERTNLINGHTTTCGHTKGVSRGDKGDHPLYDIYMAMVNRCTNPNNAQAKHYSKRGVTLHPDWSNDTPAGFENFFEWATTVGGWKKGLHLDKEAVDHNNLIYGPDTCRFVPQHVNAASSRKKELAHQPSSRFIGVHYPNRKRDAAWIAKLRHNGENHTIGYFQDEEEAARARDEFIVKNNLPHRRNFPDA